MKKRLLSLLCVILLLLAVEIPAFADAYGTPQKAINSVVRVYTEYDVYDEDGEVVFQDASMGSAFAVGERNKPVQYFITNRHCVAEDVLDLSETYGIVLFYKPVNYYIIMDNNSVKYPVTVVTDNAGGADLAILKLREATDKREAAVLHPYTDASGLITSKVWALGYPGAATYYLNEEQGADYDLMSGTDRITVTDGVFSAEIDSSISAVGGTLIQTTTPINHGNSGGPLVDSKGGVLGVCTYGITQDSSGVVQGMNAAVSVNEVVKLLEANNIPYRTVNNTGWYIYAILGAAILAVIVLVIAILKKKAPKPDAKPEVKPDGGQINNDNAVPAGKMRTLVCVNGPLAKQRFPLKPGGKLIVGRDAKQCNVVLPDGTTGVSRVHCMISFDGNTATITDLNSSYGTFVSGQKLTANVGTHLHRGLPVDIGSDKNRFTLQ